MELLQAVPLDAGLDDALASVPVAPGVGQILGSEGRSLLIGRPANLRRWAATNLGRGRPPRKGVRPPVDLSPVAMALAYVPTTSPFHQRLAYERLMARYVPAAARRDLKPPYYLHLDPGERFPRLTARRHDPAGRHLFGPFRDRGRAEYAIKALHKRVALRPCDFVFEPDPALPLGLGCVYAQVRSCAAPCLARVSEEAYREMARGVAEILASPASREPAMEAWLPVWVGPSPRRRALVAEPGAAGIELYPVSGLAVVEEGAVRGPLAELPALVRHLAWGEGPVERDDAPWLSAWLHAPRRQGLLLDVEDMDAYEGPAARIRAVFGGSA